MDEKLSPEGEAIADYGAATMAAIKLVIICLEANGTLQPGQYPRHRRMLPPVLERRQGSI